MRSTLIYALGGAAFGLCFPVVATLLSAYSAGGTLAPSALLGAQASDPLLWIIDSAPLWLSLFAGLAGHRQDRADQLKREFAGQLAQREHAEELLDRASREQKAITDVIPDVLYVVDTRGRLLKWNRRLKEITGLTPGELYERKVLSFFLEEERSTVTSAFRRLMTRDETQVDAHFITREGPVLYQRNGIPLRDETGRLIGLAGTGRDVSEQHRMREALERSERDYRGLFEHAHDAIIVLDASDHGVLAVNERACDLYGFTKDELTTQAAHLFPFRQAGAAACPEASPSTQGARRFRMVQRRKDGTSVHVEANVARVEYQGHPALLCVSRDITQQMAYEEGLRRAKEQAEASARLKTSIISNINHEFRTPLSAILGYADILSEEVSGVQQEFTGYIQENGQRLRDTLDAMLNLSRLEADELELSLERLDLSQVVQGPMQAMQHLADKKGISLQVINGEHPAYALLDRNAAETVVRHLVSNALKFTEHGEVVVKVEKRREAVCLSVRDTGIGIGDAFLPELFEAFKQESTGAARLHEGSGLGLALTRRLVEAMNGRIVVETERGTGTTFYVYFPRAERSDAVPRKVRKDRSPLGNAFAPRSLTRRTSSTSSSL